MKRPRTGNQAGNEAGPHRPAVPAEAIPAGQLWPLDYLRTRCGYGSSARAAAIRAGLRVFRWGKRSWVLTDELIAFLIREGSKPTPAGDAVEDGPDHQSSARPRISTGKAKLNGQKLPRVLQT